MECVKKPEIVNLLATSCTVIICIMILKVYMKGLITIVCYNRLNELRRLLTCLKDTNSEGITLDLVISIDKSDVQYDVKNIAEDFDWKLGNKSIIAREKNLGLKAHVINCMSLSSNYDFNVILEDDLLISPFFIDYIKECLLLEQDPSVGMYSLYSYNKKEKDKTPFYPLIDSFDAFYMQFPSSWGFFITNSQWKCFQSFLSKYDCDFFSDPEIPSFISSWSASSWKKHFCRFLVKENKQVLYPRFSLTSNTGVDGTHESDIGDLYSVPIVLGARSWSVPRLKESNCIYDVNFNLFPKSLSEYNSVFNDGFTIGTKDVVNKAEFLSKNSYIKPIESLCVVWFTAKRYIVKFKIKLFRYYS
jgi:hypothetical protein